MKRSEAKNLIQTQIAINCGAVKFPLSVDDLCDKILQSLEEAGMMPPENGTNYGTGEDYFENSTPSYAWDEE